MISKFIKEQKRYTQQELQEAFNCSESKTIEIIKKLKEYGVLKAVKFCDAQKDLSDLADTDILVTDVDNSLEDCYYVFTFVGIITISGIILKCYPKYITNKTNPLDELKLILRVIERYNSKEQIIKLFNGSEDHSSFNLLAVILFLLRDYQEHGLYSNSQNIIETNGNGEIMWDKTINDSFALISNNRPFYPELQTKKRVDDDFDYFKRLHECVLTLCSKEIKDTDLADLFDDIALVDLTDEELIDFGDTNYILYRLENELNIQFNTHKQIVLKTLYTYISQNKSIEDLDSFSMFGTNCFNLIWEDVCSHVLDDVLHVKLEKLKLPIPLIEKYKPFKKCELIELIDKPYWIGNGWEKGIFTTSTLIPDLVNISNNTFFIFDAKYYNLQMAENKEIRGQPGIESITKQYLYQMAYKEFVSDQGFKKVVNCFLFPSEGASVEDKGQVSIKMLSDLGLEPIRIKLLPAKVFYDHYLAKTHFDPNSL